MKPFDIKINHFCSWNSRQQQLSLYTLKFSESLSLLSPKKNRKKNEVWYIIEVLKFKGIDYPRSKNYG